MPSHNSDLIEPYWNVKSQHREQIFVHINRFNRTILECKGLYIKAALDNDKSI